MMMNSDQLKASAVAHLEAAKEFALQAYVQAKLAAFDIKRTGDDETANGIVDAANNVKEESSDLDNFIDIIG